MSIPQMPKLVEKIMADYGVKVTALRTDRAARAKHRSYVMTGVEEEVRVTDPITGGEKGSKQAQLGSMDPLAMYCLAEVAGMGASKYAAFNYLKGYSWLLSINAALRHIFKFSMGEQLDPESGLHHMAHAAWHCLALVSFDLRGLGTDDRYIQGREAA